MENKNHGSSPWADSEELRKAKRNITSLAILGENITVPLLTDSRK
jgi:hypothetical protein